MGEIDRLECIDYRRALWRGQQWRVFDAGVRIRRDVAQQRAADLPRAREIFDVALMQRVECPVHHRHLLPVLPELSISNNHRLRSRYSTSTRASTALSMT